MRGGAIRLESFRDRHVGEPCAILANGASILDHDLSKINCKTIGTNRSWELLWPTYHVIVDVRQEMNHPEVYKRLADEGRLFVSGACFTRGIKLPIAQGGTFSRDLTEGVVISLNGIGSVAYVALQIAAWMGFAPIYFLGLDLGGEHFHKEWDVTPIIERQNELFAHVPELEVYNVGSPESRCLRFPKLAFDAVRF